MISPDFEIRLKREAKTSLQVFKDQSLLRRKFGDDAVKLYDRIIGNRTAHELMEELHMPDERFVSILEFMNNNAMVSIVPDHEVRGRDAPLGEPGDEGADGEKTPADEEGQSIPSDGEPAEPPQEEGEPEGEPADSSHEESGPPEGSDEPPAEEEEEKPRARTSRGREIRPEPSPEEEGESLLSPLEKVLFEKYGDVGVRIYNLIDGEKTAEEILRETGVTEARLVEILEFMDEQGIIKLEKPPEIPVAEKEEETEKSEPDQEPRFKPIVEEEPEETPFSPPKAPDKEKPKSVEQKIAEEEEGLDEEIVMVDVPELARLSLMQKALLFAELSTKFGKSAKELVELVDGKRDFIDLSLNTGLSFFDIDAIMAYFGKKGLVSFRQLERDEIKKKYGEDGFAIYKRFGRDGLLLYEMIGKEASLKDIIVKSKLDTDRSIEILIFIHRVLGLDVPIDKGLIYRQLGMRKSF